MTKRRSLCNRASRSASRVIRRSSSSSSARRMVIGLPFSDMSNLSRLRGVRPGGVTVLRREMGLLHGQCDDEARPLAGPPLGDDRAAVSLDDLAAERQPDPGALIDVAWVQALEDAEDALLVLLIEADAVVGHGE